MCGRFVTFIDDDFYPRFNLSNVLYDIKPNYNVAPTQKVPVIIDDGKKNKAEIMNFGLIPPWDKDGTKKLINARGESVTSKRTFKEPFRKRRCIIPVHGWYEWQKHKTGKTPFFIHSEKHKYLGLAGIYNIYKNKKGNEEKAFAIITGEPTKDIKYIHHRMPVILDLSEEEPWLEGGDPDFLESLILSKSKIALDSYEISKEVNNPRNNSSSLIKEMIKLI